MAEVIYYALAAENRPLPVFVWFQARAKSRSMVATWKSILVSRLSNSSFVSR